MQELVRGSSQMVAWKYDGKRKPGMYNIVLRGKSPFYALIGFNLRIPIIKYSGFDYYGFARSGKDKTAVFLTYLGRTPCEFQFLTNKNTKLAKIVVTSNQKDQLLQPDIKFAPHWYQWTSFYG